MADRNYYFPFGGNRGGAFNTVTTKRFTGQYHESTLPGGEGLSYYGARWYDAKLGKFLTPDSIVPGPGDPQAFNRYSYVKNRPLVMIDPTGHYDIKPGDAPYSSNTSSASNSYSAVPGAGWTNIYHYNVYLPVISNQQARPPASASPYRAACPGSMMCLSTPTPTATPTRTPTPGAMLMQGPTPSPTRTPIPNGSINWGGMYWAGIEAYASGVPEILDKNGWGLGMVEVKGEKLSATVIARYGIPVAKTIPWVGWGVAAGPNLYSNLRYGDGFTGRKLYVDLLTDTVGWSATNLAAVGGTFIGLAAAPESGPLAPVVPVLGYIGGAATGNALWDTFGAPRVSAGLNSAIDYFMSE